MNAERAGKREDARKYVRKLIPTSGAREFTSYPSSESPPKMKRQLNRLESYNPSGNVRYTIDHGCGYKWQ